MTEQNTRAEAVGETARNPSLEIEAMQGVTEALGKLNQDAVARVLGWAADFYGLKGLGDGSSQIESRLRSGPATRGAESQVENAVDTTGKDFEDVADLFHAIDPSSDAQKALVVGYWLQEHESQPDFDAQSVNTELKHMGYRVGNITRALNQLKNSKPALVIQKRKMGSTQQARKRYKVTDAGVRHIERTLSGGDKESE